MTIQQAAREAPDLSPLSVRAAELALVHDKSLCPSDSVHVTGRADRLLEAVGDAVCCEALHEFEDVRRHFVGALGQGFLVSRELAPWESPRVSC